MWGLWNRSLQARAICSCSACATTRGVLTRRPALSPPQKGVGRHDLCVFFSSTLAFSAAVVDSLRKDARSRHWEKVIGETRDQIEATEAEQEQRLKALLEKNVEESDNRRALHWPALGATHTTTWSDVLDWSAALEMERVSAGFKDWQGIPLDILKSLSRSELYELANNKRILHRFYGGPSCEDLVPRPLTHPLNSKKLRTLEWSVLKLAIRLLNHVSISPSDEKTLQLDVWDSLSHLTLLNCQERAEYLDEANVRLARLRAEDQYSNLYDNFPSPKSPQFIFSPNQKEAELKYFNYRLQETLKDVGCTSATGILQICTALLLLRIAPDIHTYNLLLIKFCRLGEPDLVHAVLESLRETLTRPNEITHATLLRFFTVTKNRHWFSKYLKQMNGLNYGLVLADADRKIHPIAQSRYHWFDGISKIKIAEKARLNPEVYTSLIEGLLQMFNAQEAMQYYYKMISEGWGPTMQLLNAILRNCHEIGDFDSATKVWQQMCYKREHGPFISQEAYECILDLCHRFRRTDIYREIVHDGISWGVLPLDCSTETQQGRPIQNSDSAISKMQPPEQIVINQHFLEKKATIRCRARKYYRLERKVASLSADITAIAHDCCSNTPSLYDRVGTDIRNFNQKMQSSEVQEAYKEFQKRAKETHTADTSLPASTDKNASHRAHMGAHVPAWLNSQSQALPLEVG